ncbi:MAG: 2-succinyl-5-enolpyruvyl-6-hydroxy-3-cyclohexene-1-carboxylic-acid synthase [Bacteroides sp.]|nr:2-succinyl-5-enolpyruvyl-6-hydroxy-3-cyclohexene-1-carboxylic-acid synthase [Bacteroides sp.]
MENVNTSNPICRIIADLLSRHGVKMVFASPGSRNAPLLMAISRNDELKCEMVVDERSAAFMALGYASISQEPVALVCTSGTALLNYAPAIAEAYYRKTPIVVISADRPKAWIGQDDSQTIVQPDALSNYVKRSYDISADFTDNNLWYANRIVNDALITTQTGRQGPVHINVQIDEPISALSEFNFDTFRASNRIIEMVKPVTKMETNYVRTLGRTIASPRKVMIVCGFMQPDKTLNTALNRLSRLPNFVVLTETIANLHGDLFIAGIDATLAAIKDGAMEQMIPEVVITAGGALVSRHIKKFLRDNKVCEHWHIGEIEDTIDCFKQLTKRIEMQPAIFFQQLASAMQPHKADSDYSTLWEAARCRAWSLTQSFAAKTKWSDFKLFSTLIPLIPRNWNCQFSNGTSIRYCQIFSNKEYHRCDCNRGVSGIDGSTSTAIGASLAYRNAPTLLVTGDMSALYDLGAFGCRQVSPNFKMIVVDNQGGGIFRFIQATNSMDIRESMLCVPSDKSIAAMGEAAGFAVFEANDEASMRCQFIAFSNEREKPALMVVKTPGQLSAEILNEFFRYCKTK